MFTVTYSNPAVTVTAHLLTATKKPKCLKLRQQRDTRFQLCSFYLPIGLSQTTVTQITAMLTGLA